MSDSPARRTGDLQFQKQKIDVRTALEVERPSGALNISKSRIVNDWADLQQFLVRMKADCEKTRRSRSAASQTRSYHQSPTVRLGAGRNRD